MQREDSIAMHQHGRLKHTQNKGQHVLQYIIIEKSLAGGLGEELQGYCSE